MRTVQTYIGNTAYPLIDRIMQRDDEGVLVPFQLAGRVSEVRLQAQDADTGTLMVDAVATPTETADPETTGDVAYTPQAGDVAAEHRYIAWWRLTLIGGGVTDTPEFLWEVVPHGVHAPSAVTPTGVCQAWATNADVNRYTPAAEDTDFSSWLVEASELLYILSARQFPGVCADTVRPANSSCGCWQVLSRGHIVLPQLNWIAGEWWAESQQWQTPGCGMLRAVRLAGHANTVTEVRISGSVVDPATYRLDDNEWLVRLTDPATGQNPGWPACQDLSLPAGASGTFEIDYTWGQMPSIAGVRAAATLAWQLWLNDNPRGKGEKCKLPAGWTSITRQGITVTRPQVQRLATEGTGIVGIDAFLQSANPNGIDREPAVYSRDILPYAQRVG